MVRPSPAAEEGNEHPGWKCCYCTDGKTLVVVPLTTEELRNGPDSTKKITNKESNTLSKLMSNNIVVTAW